MGQLLGPDFPTDIGLAVSGGGDSMAMLYLAHNWTRVYGLRLWVVTINHDLRPDAAGEAQLVADECALLGWPHATLIWRGDKTGNLMEAARHARLSLIDAWRGDLRHVLMAHTADDVAEGFLMRLRRGSGVDGLAAMSDLRTVRIRPDQRLPLAQNDRRGQRFPPDSGAGRGSYFVVRPLLHTSRQALRRYLIAMLGRWVDDPTNENTSFERARTRKLLTTLQDAGLTSQVLTQTAHRMAQARAALTARTQSIARGTVHRDWTTGEVRITRDALAGVEDETKLRLLAEALQWVSSDPLRPRLQALHALSERVMAGGSGTLHGCEVVAHKAHLQVFREYGAVAQLRGPVSDVSTWDQRWVVQAPDLRGMTLRALGPDGWVQVPEKPQDSPAFRSARSLPAVFDGDKLVACAGLNLGPTGAFRLRPVVDVWTDLPQ